MSDFKKYFNPKTTKGKATIAGTAVVTAVALSYICYRLFRTSKPHASSDCACCTAEKAASLYAPQHHSTPEKSKIPHDPHKQKSAVFADDKPTHGATTKHHEHSESGSRAPHGRGSYEPPYERDESRHSERHSRRYDDYEPERHHRDYSRERHRHSKRYSEPPCDHPDHYSGRDSYDRYDRRSYSNRDHHQQYHEGSRCDRAHQDPCPNCGYSSHRNYKPSCNHSSHYNERRSYGGHSHNTESQCRHEKPPCKRESNCSQRDERRSSNCGSSCSHNQRSQGCGSNYSHASHDMNRSQCGRESHSQSNRCQKSHNNERKLCNRSNCSNVSHDKHESHNNEEYNHRRGSNDSDHNSNEKWSNESKSLNTEPVSNTNVNQENTPMGKKSGCKAGKAVNIDNPNKLKYCQKKQLRDEMQNGIAPQTPTDETTKESEEDDANKRKIKGERLYRNAGAAMGAP